MSEHVATEYAGTGPVPGALAKDKAMLPEQDVRQPLRRSPACERKR
jgi:hypothetical protein